VPTATTSNECNDEAIAVWNCARPLYCADQLDEDLSFIDDLFPDPDACFSLESTVEVKRKGTTAIKDLTIGDMVLSDDKGTYTMYYSKDHFGEDTPATFLRIFTETFNKKPLELTGNHLVYKATEALPVPARSIKVGDVLKTIDGQSKVTFIKKVKRNGFFGPFTLSGSIVCRWSCCFNLSGRNRIRGPGIWLVLHHEQEAQSLAFLDPFCTCSSSHDLWKTHEL
jgi:hypothetical protein